MSVMGRGAHMQPIQQSFSMGRNKWACEVLQGCYSPLRGGERFDQKEKGGGERDWYEKCISHENDGDNFPSLGRFYEAHKLGGD